MADLITEHRQFLERVYNQKDLRDIDTHVHPNHLNHYAYPGQKPGIEGVRQTAQAMLHAFPDIQITIEQMIQQGDLLVTRWTMRGTHIGTLFGVPPTGQQATWTGTDWVLFENGQAREFWGHYDIMTMVMQLGIDIRNVYGGTGQP